MEISPSHIDGCLIRADSGRDSGNEAVDMSSTHDECVSTSIASRVPSDIEMRNLFVTSGSRGSPLNRLIFTTCLIKDFTNFLIYAIKIKELLHGSRVGKILHSLNLNLHFYIKYSNIVSF